MNVITRPLPDAISLDVARNCRIQSLEGLQGAIQDWRDASGTGNYRCICARFVLLCIRDFRAAERHYNVTWRETIGNRRAE